MRQILVLLLALLLGTGQAAANHPQLAQLADGALPPASVTISDAGGGEVIRFRVLNPAQQVEVARFDPGASSPASTTTFSGNDRGYLGAALEWYRAPRPAADSQYWITESFADGSSARWGPFRWATHGGVANASPSSASTIFLPLVIN